ncbi:hypothetical protein [Rhodococcus sp. USK10]|uniref:thiolase family protein n=1 Tax=Rhodococcus sp. USK10 TaxID=2789739 RepID=UPI002151926A|nr:hypothetical protein [Rhodococcus sp. USK10]
MRTPPITIGNLFLSGLQAIFDADRLINSGDAIICAFDHVSMGEATDRHVKGTGIDRAGQNAFAARSHELAAAATEDGR